MSLLEINGQIGERFLEGLTGVLESFVRANSQYAGSGCNTVFHVQRVPGITVPKYISRLARHFCCMSEDMIVAVILIDRLLYNQPTFRFTAHTFHRIFLTSLLVSVKSRQDFFYNNAYYAAAGGVRLQDINMLEEHFLLALDFDTYVDDDTFSAFMQELRQQFPPEEGE